MAELDAGPPRSAAWEMCVWMQELGDRLKVPQPTIAVAMTYFHKFIRFHSIQRFDRYIVACTCLFLSGKSEDTYIPIRDLINIAHLLRYPDKPHLCIGPEYWNLRDSIVQTEAILLRTLGFNVEVDLPYRYLLNILNTLGASEELAQASWNIINETICTTINLDYSPQHVACSTIYLAAHLLRITLPSRWWQVFDVPFPTIEKICLEVISFLEEYSRKNRPKAPTSTPSTQPSSPASVTSASLPSPPTSLPPPGE